MKKFLAILLTLTIIAGMSGVVFADNNGNGEDYKDSEPVTIKKEINLTNDDTENPEETFTFTIGEGEGVRDEEKIEDVPQFEEGKNTFEITVGQGEETGLANINLELPEFSQVGIYTYPITEVKGNTAGMIYSEETNYLKITVINNPDYVEDGNEPEFLRVFTLTVDDDDNKKKVDNFENEFSAGELVIKKEVTGNYSDPNDEFTVTVTVKPVGGYEIKDGPIKWNTENLIVNKDDDTIKFITAEYTLSENDGAITIENLPYNVEYTVEETDPGKYTLESYSAEGGFGGITGDDGFTGEFNAKSITVTITNNRDTDIQVGVALDNLPYIIAIAVVILGLAVFTVRRRIFN